MGRAECLNLTPGGQQVIDATFLGWENDFGPGNQSDNPCLLSLDRDQMLTARFSVPIDAIFSDRFE